MSIYIKAIEEAQLKKDLPEFRPGDTVVVQVEVKEGGRTRMQAFEGVVIAKRNRGLNSSFTVRKISHGEGVERVFQTHSPVVKAIEVKRRGQVRKAKLYHLRGLSGKGARIRERLNYSEEAGDTTIAAGAGAGGAAATGGNVGAAGAGSMVDRQNDSLEMETRE